MAGSTSVAVDRRLPPARIAMGHLLGIGPSAVYVLSMDHRNGDRRGNDCQRQE
jgi:hypothetical protein